MPESEDEQRPLVACLTVGKLQANCYIFACPQTLEAVIIDPGAEPERIIQLIQEHRFQPTYILLTHGHFDHISAVDAVSAVYPVPLAMHEADVPLLTDATVATNWGLPSP